MNPLANCKICRRLNMFMLPTEERPRRCNKPCENYICEICRVCCLRHASISQIEEMKENIRVEQHRDIDKLCADQRKQFTDIINKHQLDRNEIYEEIERRNNVIKEKYEHKFNAQLLKRNEK